MSPRQDSVMSQLIDLVALANERGMYDAADWITRKFADHDFGQAGSSKNT